MSMNPTRTLVHHIMEKDANETNDVFVPYTVYLSLIIVFVVFLSLIPVYLCYRRRRALSKLRAAQDVELQ